MHKDVEKTIVVLNDTATSVVDDVSKLEANLNLFSTVILNEYQKEVSIVDIYTKSV
jgi:hypothetical protein